MTKPIPEQFDLTVEMVKSLTEEQAQREKRRKDIINTILKGFWKTWTVVCVLIFIYLLTSMPGVLDAFLFQFFAVMPSAFGIGFFFTIVVFGVMELFFDKFGADAPRRMDLKRFEKAMAQYESWFVRTQEAFWEGLTGRRFELEVTRLLTRAGYRARITPSSGDGGVDIVLGDGTIVQCKAHRVPASPGVVRELYGALIHQKAPKAMLISLNGVTSGVRSFIQDKPITVWDKTNLIALQKTLDKS